MTPTTPNVAAVGPYIDWGSIRVAECSGNGTPLTGAEWASRFAVSVNNHEALIRALRPFADWDAYCEAHAADGMTTEELRRDAVNAAFIAITEAEAKP